ncbi:MAG: winged helix-turn-helix domain-containing protein [Thermoproteota archaeon]|nr:winged helix-turn-helix domain-containing protein [Thermoproteota archaeon]
MSELNETYNNIKLATPFARQRLILDYIIRHPGLSQNQIAVGVRRFMTRQVALKHIKDMTKEGLLTVQKAASGAAYSYFAQFNNPLVKLSQDVFEFETAMCTLIQKAASQIEFRYWESPDGYTYADVLKLQKRLRPVFDLFKHFVDFYLRRATINWRYDVTNEETRKEMYALVIESIGRIQEAMFEELRRAGVDSGTIGVLFKSAWSEVDEAKMLAKLAQQLEKIGLKKEGLDAIEKMPKRLKMSYIVHTIQKVDGKFDLEKKRLHEDGRLTPLR